MKITRVYRKGPYNRFHFCGEEWGYGLFRDRKPKDVAKQIIRDMFGDDTENKIFLYWVRVYRGRNSLQDMVEVYYQDYKNYDYDKNTN